jgi:hypothetical protein
MRTDRCTSDERIDHRLGSILILPDLLIFLFHPLHLSRTAPTRSERDRSRSAHTRVLGFDARYLWDAALGPQTRFLR